MGPTSIISKHWPSMLRATRAVAESGLGETGTFAKASVTKGWSGWFREYFQLGDYNFDTYFRRRENQFPRTRPDVEIPQGPADKLASNRYYERDVRRRERKIVEFEGGVLTKRFGPGTATQRDLPPTPANVCQYAVTSEARLNRPTFHMTIHNIA